MENLEKYQNENIFEIVDFIRSNPSDEDLIFMMDSYHDNDIADSLEYLTKEEREHLYSVIGTEKTSEIFAYLEDVEDYIEELNLEVAAEIIGSMDSDDAVDVLEDVDDEKVADILNLMDDESEEDIRKIQSYDEEEIGSRMTTNYILISKNSTIKQAMKELIDQAHENDNINTIFTYDIDNTFYGAIYLNDLIIARADEDINDIIINNYPVIHDKELVVDVLEQIKDYAENSYPILNDNNELIGVITAQDIIETVDEELSDDYVKLGGLTSEEDLNETTIQSVKKRLPWLGVLLVLGILVSSVVSVFEEVVASITILISFQSLVLDMTGNAGTQSLAVTIRVLMDEETSWANKLKLIWKEVRVGFLNGTIIGTVAFVVIGLYIFLFKGYPAHYSFGISACVGIALLVAMIISSLVGTTIPILFEKIGVDPAVASGPFITTINDLVAVVVYYGLAWVLLINVMHI